MCLHAAIKPPIALEWQSVFIQGQYLLRAQSLFFFFYCFVLFLFVFSFFTALLSFSRLLVLYLLFFFIYAFFSILFSETFL